MFIVSPSLLAADFANLAEEVKKIELAGAQYLHLDVMDGMFVPNISFGLPVISSLRKHSKMIFDVHLMIKDPQRYIEDFLRAGADIITIHYESCDDPLSVVRQIKALEARAAVSIKPATPAEVLYPMLDELDMVLVMTVEPGFGGQKIIMEALDKVRAIREYANSKGIDIDIQVDGGITGENVKYATSAGANVVVAGSAVFKSDDPAAVIAQMKSEAELYPYGSALNRE